MQNNASGSLLAQYTAGDAVANTVFTGGGLQTEITRIVVCNTGAGAATFRLFHDDTGGATYLASNALYYDKSVNSGDTFVVEITGPNGGIHVSRNGTIGFQDSSSGDITLSLYGMTQTAAGRR